MLSTLMCLAAKRCTVGSCISLATCETYGIWKVKSEGAMEGQKMGENSACCFEVVETHLQLRRGMRGGVTCLKHIPPKSYALYLFFVC